MKLTQSKVEVLPQEPTLEGAYKQIEIAGRTCYKSEDKITEDSVKEFVDRMIKLGHGAMLEHGTIYLIINVNNKHSHFWRTAKAKRFSKVVREGYRFYVTTNLRVIVENKRMKDLAFVSEPAEYHEKRITARFTCDRGVSHELVRHRVFSFAQESQRYCNYSKDKFKNEITFIVPSWLNIPEGNYTYWDGDWVDVDNMKIQIPADEKAVDYFLFLLNHAELSYRALMNNNWQPQRARTVLPNATKTEVVMTGFESDWRHFFDLRCAKNAHPDMRKLALELLEQLKDNPTFKDLYEKYCKEE